MSNEALLRDWSGKIIELTARKKKLVQEILQLTEKQAGLLVPEQAVELLQSVNQRQKCIDDINAIDALISQAKAEAKNGCGAASRPAEKGVLASEQQKVESLQQDIQALLRKAQSMDQRNRQAIAKECEELKKEFQSLHVRRKCLKAYQKVAVQSDGYFIDHKK